MFTSLKQLLSMVSRNAIILGALAVTMCGMTLIAAPANASTVNWDAVAQCESGGNWTIATGNGFYGGLQFTIGTWRAHGGTGMPQNASRSEQIAVAERVLATQGIGAWPVCGHHSGSPVTHARHSIARHSIVRHSVLRHSTGTHHVTRPAVRSVQSTPREHAPLVPTSPVPTSPVTAPTLNAAAGAYVVVPGDTLSRIALIARLGDWRVVFALNSAVITNPDLIFPGERLAL